MIRVLFFGQVADVMGQREVESSPQSLSLLDLREHLFGKGTRGESLASKVLMSVNSEVVRDERRLQPGDEVAFFSPFSGG